LLHEPEKKHLFHVHNQYDWDSINTKSDLIRKAQKILDLIPSDVQNIIDIGCGDGTLTNVLASRYHIIGLDINLQGLARVKTLKILSTANETPVADSTFDLVFSSELLEHLDSRIMEDTIYEMERISKKYILITVPNNETIERDYIKCPHCNHVFNKSYHQRSFTKNKISVLFPNHEVIRHIEFGVGKRHYNKLLLKIKHRYSSPNSWIPKRWTGDMIRKTMCPKCLEKFEYLYQFHPVSFLCDIINLLISPHRPYWLFVLLKSRDVRNQNHC